MATTKLFYQEPIGGESIYERDMNQCISQEAADSYIIAVGESNVGNGALFFNSGKDSSRYLRFSDLNSCVYKVQLSTSGTGYWVAGQTVTVGRKIYNPFKYKLNSPQLKLYVDYTSYAQSPRATWAAVSNIAANSSTTITQLSFSIPYPDIIGSDLYNIPHFSFNYLDGDPNGTLITSGNTDIGKNLSAMPVPYYASSTLLAKPVLLRPYITMTRSGSGSVNSGATVTLTCKVYNRNDGKTSATDGTLSLRYVTVRLTLSGSGFSGDAGTITWNGTSSTTSVDATGITISRTTDQDNPSYTTVTFTYTAPSTTTQGTVTITPSVPEWFYGYTTSFTNFPGTGNTINITVNAAAPSAYYFPFRISNDGGKTYLTRSDFEGTAQDLSTLVMRLTPTGGTPGKTDDVYIPYSQWNILSGYNTIWYVSTTAFSTLISYGAYGMNDTSDPKSGGISCDEISFPDFDSDYTMPTSATYSAFNSAGIYDGWYLDACTVVGCTGNEIWIEDTGNGTLRFRETGSICASSKVAHLYCRVMLVYQNASYGPSTYRTLVYDLAKQWSNDGSTWSNTSFGGACSVDYYEFSSTQYPISDTWNGSPLSTLDIDPDYGNAYIEGLSLSYSSSGPWDDASLGEVNPGNRYDGSFEFSGYDPSGLFNYGSGSGYAWYELCPVFTSPCSAMVAAGDEMYCNNCNTLFCSVEGCCPNCGECKDIYPTGNPC